MTLTDQSRMPFGIHSKKPMSEVPASYLHYLWTDGIGKDPRPDRKAVADYIRANMTALKQEHPDGIWKL